MVSTQKSPTTPGTPKTSSSSLISAESAATSGASLALDVLKDVLEAVDTLPAVKYIASVAVQVMEIVDEIHANRIAFKSLAARALEIATAVANARGDNGEIDAGEELQKHLQQLTGMMTEVLQFATSCASRKGYKRIIYKTEDAETAKLLDLKLTQAFQLFEIQSSMSIRLSQREMAKRIADIHTHQNKSLTSSTPAPALLTICPLHIPDGIYAIQNASSGRVLELATNNRPKHLESVFTAVSQEGFSQTQLWSIVCTPAHENRYIIRNLASGQVLEISFASSHTGAAVCCYPFNGGLQQMWHIYGAKSGTAGDICTIRSCGPATILDATCPIDAKCERVHMVDLRQDRPSQEWTLLRYPYPAPTPSPTSSLTGTPLTILPRRMFHLRNVRSGRFAVRINDRRSNANVAAERFRSWPWYFAYVRDENQSPTFAILSSDKHFTMDHWGGVSIACSHWNPTNPHHMWHPIPRERGAFIFKNHKTGRLLTHDDAQNNSPSLNTADASAFEDAACHWALIDADESAGQSSCTIVCDTTISLLPPALGPALDQTTQTTPVVPDHLKLRVEAVPTKLQARFMQAMEPEHDALLELLQSGYDTFVLSPGMIWACRKGKWKIVTVVDSASVYRSHTYRDSGRWPICE